PAPGSAGSRPAGAWWDAARGRLCRRAWTPTTALRDDESPSNHKIFAWIECLYFICICIAARRIFRRRVIFFDEDISFMRNLHGLLPLGTMFVLILALLSAAFPVPARAGEAGCEP